jgi:hypothetical protein
MVSENGMNDARVAFLWDESFLWGLMALKSFYALGLEPVVVTADEVKGGALRAADILFVPGGWASDKTVALGEAGREAVRDFVQDGGSYLGFCGGAGLALDVEGGLSLTHVTRVPTRHRVPSFSGEIELVPEDKSHPLWRGITQPYIFHAWWPGQFHIGEGKGARVVARYGEPGKDFCIADLCVDDVYMHDEGWGRWEQSYGINLDPERLKGEPAMIETSFGKGKVFLSYLHLETPGSIKGNGALVNLISYLKPAGRKPGRKPAKGRAKKKYPISHEAIEAAAEMMGAAKGFIHFGERNFLWYWRNSWVLQWRRGVRGVEYSMLYTMINEIAGGVRKQKESSDPDLSGKITAARDRVLPFFADAKALLMKERFALAHGVMSSIKGGDHEVTRLREKLFSSSKRFGGEFKELLGMLDEVVLAIMKG